MQHVLLKCIFFPKVENVRLVDRLQNQKTSGTLYVTATHLIFVDPAGKHETWVSPLCFQWVKQFSLEQCEIYRK